MTTALLAKALPETQQAFNDLANAASDQGIQFVFADGKFAGVRTQADTTEILADRQSDYNAYVAAFKKAHPGGTPLSIYDKWDTDDAGNPAARPIAPWGSSFHDFGAAFDIIPVSWPDGMNIGDAQNALGAIAPTVGLRWGGDWPGTKRDPRHFELAISLDDAKSRWEALQGSTSSDDASVSSGSSTAAVVGILAAVGLIAGAAWWAARTNGWLSVR